MAKPHSIIYTDGACDGNPGRGGYGVVLLEGESRRELSRGFRLTTNNRMELLAAVVGLEALDEPSRVTLYSDSKYLVDAMNQGWASEWKDAGWVRKAARRVPNADLWAKLLALVDEHEVIFEWVKGHSGVRDNERADALSYAAIDKEDLLEDEGYLDRLELEKVAPSRITEEGQPCRKCGTPVVKQKPTSKRKPDQAYYFEYYLYCPGCETRYTVEDAKKNINQGKLFDM
jgi:ribonuclease HI